MKLSELATDPFWKTVFALIERCEEDVPSRKELQPQIDGIISKLEDLQEDCEQDSERHDALQDCLDTLGSLELGGSSLSEDWAEVIEALRNIDCD